MMNYNSDFDTFPSQISFFVCLFFMFSHIFSLSLYFCSLYQINKHTIIREYFAYTIYYVVMFSMKYKRTGNKNRTEKHYLLSTYINMSWHSMLYIRKWYVVCVLSCFHIHHDGVPSLYKYKI